ncbi:MAG TPA: hypothetical protein EYP85_17350 [Armatimonadetes bacterium]|nr:hypothetical protein [Armatimonadota bacterium]
MELGRRKWGGGWWWGAVLFLAAPGGADIMPEVGGAGTLEYTARVGTQIKYETQVSGKMQLEYAEETLTLRIAAHLPYQETVIAADEETIRLTCAIQAGEVKTTGEKPAQAASIDLTWPVRMRRLGTEVEIEPLKRQQFKSLSALGGLMLFIETTRLLGFPAHPVEEGDSWDTELELEVLNGVVPVEVESKLSGREEREGRPCYLVESEFEGPLDFSGVELDSGAVVNLQGEQQGRLKTWFAPKEGCIVRVEGHLWVELTPKPPEEKEGEIPPFPQHIRFEFEFHRTLKHYQPGT